MRHENLIRAFCATPWAITPEKLDKILSVVSLRASGVRLSADAIAEARAERRAGGSSTQGTVQVLPLYGTVAHRMDLFTEMSGGTSTERFGKQFDAAVADPNVSAIVLDIDSPGGAVDGTEELAAKILRARGTKPIYAVANALAASAAYWIGTAADEFAVTPSGEVGSIGVFMVHFDESRALDDLGITPTLIKAGEFKAEGNPYGPLPDEAREHLQAQVEEVYARFLGAVASARGVSVSEVRAEFGQGRTVMAKDAVRRGMADRVATLDEVIARASAGKSLKARTRAATTTTLPLAAGPLASAWVTSSSGVARVGGYEIDFTVAANDAAPETADADTGAAPDEQDHPGDQPAAEAKELPVSKDTTAANAAAPSMEDRAAELSALALEHGKDMATYNAWLKSGKSADEIRGDLLSEYRSVARPASANVGHSATATYGQSAPVRVTVGTERETTRPFSTFGEYCATVASAYTPGGAVDPRLKPLAAVTGMSQGVPSDGGYLIAPQFSQMIWDGLQDSSESLLGMTDSYTVEPGAESITFNANAETSRATGSRKGGVQAYWIAEADQMTASKPKFRQVRLEPHQLAVMVYLTDKLIKNSPTALGQYVARAAQEEIAFFAGNSIVRGTGAGQPLGVLNAACKIEVAKETSQAAATINQKNISKMWSRLHPRSRARAVWLHNVDIEPQLDQLSTTVMNVASTENVGGYADKVFDPERRTLKGRPLVASEFCETLGTAGDLILVDLGLYATATRGGVESDMSIHLRFDYNETAFRFLFELDGQPWLSSALTPFKGSNTLSSIVTLATRS